MTTINEFLESHGYKQIETPRYADKDQTWYQKPSKEYGLPLCETNEKQPTFFLKHHTWEVPGHKHESFEIGLDAEHCVWWDLQAYSMSFKELQENIEIVEYKLARAWKGLHHD